MHNLSCENEFYLHENEKSFSYLRLSAYPRFDTEARGSSEMTYLHLFQTIAQNVGTPLLIHIQRSAESECQLAKKISK